MSLFKSSDAQPELTPTQYESRKAYFSTRRKRIRTKRKALLEVYQDAIGADTDNPIEIGFKAKIVGRDGSISNLPPEFAFTLAACKEFIHNKNRFPSLLAYGGAAMNRVDSRRRMAEVMAVILARTEMVDGRIGVPTSIGMDTVSMETLMQDYVLRFGKMIESSGFAKCFKRLQMAGLLHNQRNFVGVPGENGEREVRSFASYKQLTGQLFKEIKVVSYKNVIAMVLETRKRQTQRGYSFKWIPFRHLAEKLHTLLGAETLNSVPNDLHLGAHAPSLASMPPN